MLKPTHDMKCYIIKFNQKSEFCKEGVQICCTETWEGLQQPPQLVNDINRRRAFTSHCHKKVTKCVGVKANILQKIRERPFLSHF